MPPRGLPDRPNRLRRGRAPDCSSNALASFPVSRHGTERTTVIDVTLGRSGGVTKKISLSSFGGLVARPLAGFWQSLRSASKCFPSRGFKPPLYWGMNIGPLIAEIAALVGEPARA